MIFTIRTVEPAFASNDKEYLKVTGSTSEGVERTYNVFDSLKDKWPLLEPNATVELKMVQQGKFWNVENITKVGLPPVAEEAVKQGAKVISVESKPKADPVTTSIENQVALKETMNCFVADKIDEKQIPTFFRELKKLLREG